MSLRRLDGRETELLPTRSPLAGEAGSVDREIDGWMNGWRYMYIYIYISSYIYIYMICHMCHMYIHVFVIIIIVLWLSCVQKAAACIIARATTEMLHATRGRRIEESAVILVVSSMFDRTGIWQLEQPFPLPAPCADVGTFRGNHLSNTNCLTHVFFKSGE